MSKKMNLSATANATTIADALAAAGYGNGSTRIARIIKAEAAKAEEARKAEASAELARQKTVDEAIARQKAEKAAKEAEEAAKAYTEAQLAKVKATSIFSRRRVDLRRYDIILGNSRDHHFARQALLATLKALKEDAFKLAYATPDDVEAMFRVEWKKLGWTGASPEAWPAIKRALEELKAIFA